MEEINYFETTELDTILTEKSKMILEIIDGMPLQYVIQILNGIKETAQSRAIVKSPKRFKTEE